MQISYVTSRDNNILFAHDRNKQRNFVIDDDFLIDDFLQLFIDASVGRGYGTMCGAQWFFGVCSIYWQTPNITVMGLYPIMATVVMWWKAWANTTFCCFFTDNDSLVFVINKQISKESPIMVLLRRLSLTCLSYDIIFTAQHVPGIDVLPNDHVVR